MSDRRIDLSMCPSGRFCLGCGTSYVDSRSDCDECGAAVITAKDIRAQLRASLRPGAQSDGEVEVLVELLGTADARDLAAARSVLRDSEAPFLVVPDRVSPDAGPRWRIFVDERDAAWLHAELDRGEGRELTLLTSVGDVVAAMDVRQRLGVAGVRYEESQFAPQFGFAVGTLAEVQFRVLAGDVERAQAALAAPLPLPEEPAAGEPDREGGELCPPAGADDAEAEAEGASADGASAFALRVARRRHIARLCLALQGLGYLALLAVFAVAGNLGGIAVAAFVSGGSAWALARSFRDPVGGFTAGFVVSIIAVAAGLKLGPFAVVPGFMIFFATYWAARAPQAEAYIAGRSAP